VGAVEVAALPLVVEFVVGDLLPAAAVGGRDGAAAQT
jgi:hypothetical protein